MNTTDNKLVDNVSNIEATLTGTPTVNNNQIVFINNDTFNFDISSLNLTNKNRTFRIKFTPTTLDSIFRNIIGIGSDKVWTTMTTAYINSNVLRMQHGSNNFSNVTVGDTSSSTNINRLTGTTVTGQEYELVIRSHHHLNIKQVLKI